MYVTRSTLVANGYDSLFVRLTTCNDYLCYFDHFRSSTVVSSHVKEL